MTDIRREPIPTSPINETEWGADARDWNTTQHHIDPDGRADILDSERDDSDDIHARLRRLEHERDEAQRALSAQAQHDTQKAPATTNRRNLLIGSGLVAAVVAGGALFGPKLFGDNDSDPSQSGSQPPAAGGPAIPVSPEQPVAEPEVQLPPVEAIDIPGEAEGWVIEHGHKFPAEQVLGAYYADIHHEEVFGYSSLIPDDWIESYQPSSNTDGQLAGIRRLHLAPDLDFTVPENLIDYLNDGAYSALENYLNMSVRNPQARDVITNEFAILVGDHTDTSGATRLLSKLDEIAFRYGSDTVFQVRPFEESNLLLPSSATDSDPSLIFVYEDNNQIASSSITEYDEGLTPQGLDFIANLAIDVSSYGPDGVNEDSILRETVVFSAHRSMTDNYGTASVYLGGSENLSLIPE